MLNSIDWYCASTTNNEKVDMINLVCSNPKKNSLLVMAPLRTKLNKEANIYILY